VKRTNVAVMMILLAAPIPIFAKGATIKVTIAAGDGSREVVIDDAQALLPFNVWGGRGVTVNGIERSGGFIIQWARYVLNTRTILRGGFEGDWFHASRAWQELVNPLLAAPR
jgi:hypothetical protein